MMCGNWIISIVQSHKDIYVDYFQIIDHNIIENCQNNGRIFGGLHININKNYLV